MRNPGQILDRDARPKRRREARLGSQAATNCRSLPLVASAPLKACLICLFVHECSKPGQRRRDRVRVSKCVWTKACSRVLMLRAISSLDSDLPLEKAGRTKCGEYVRNHPVRGANPRPADAFSSEVHMRVASSPGRPFLRHDSLVIHGQESVRIIRAFRFSAHSVPARGTARRSPVLCRNRLQPSATMPVLRARTTERRPRRVGLSRSGWSRCR